MTTAERKALTLVQAWDAGMTFKCNECDADAVTMLAGMDPKAGTPLCKVDFLAEKAAR